MSDKHSSFVGWMYASQAR